MLPGFVQLLSPAWTWALLAAVGTPLLAHLLSRRGGRLAPFPAVRFVQQAMADCARLLRPRHWLLLILRTLLLALVAMAFARPVWYRTTPVTDPSRGMVVALVLDRSASMARTVRGTTLFEIARQQVIDTLQKLDPARDQATVVLLDSQPRPLLPEPTAGFSNLIAMVRSIELTQEHGDLEAALRSAEAEVRQAAEGGEKATLARPAYIEVHSDMQQSQWVSLFERGLTPREARLVVRPVTAVGENVALFQPRVNPVRPIVGQSAVLSVEVANFSQGDAQPTVEMRLGETRVQRTLRIPAGATLSVNFTLTPQSPGLHVAELRLLDHDDVMPLDDRTAATFIVDTARPVALVTDAPVDDVQTSAFFVARALRPEQPDVVGARLSGVALAVWKPMQLVAALKGAGRTLPHTIVICEATTLGEGELRVLYEYLRQGGGVIWVADSRASAAALARFNELAGGTALSPIVPEPELWRLGADLAVAVGQFDDPVLELFEGPARTAVLNLRFASVMAGRLPPTATPLLTFEDGTPALAMQWIGSGRLAVLGASLSPRDSDLVKGPVLVPLLHQLVRHLTPGIPVEANPHPGSRPVVAVDGRWREGELTARDETGQPVALSVAGTSAGATLVQLERRSQVGRVDILAGNDVVAAVHVELHPGESDLAEADDQTLAMFLQPVDGPAVPAVGETVVQGSLRPVGVELWPWLMAAAVMMGIVEMVVLGWWERPTRQVASFRGGRLVRDA